MQTSIRELMDKASIIRERRKTLKIVITESGELQLVAPLNMTLNKIEELVSTKQKWIVSKLHKTTTDNIKNKLLLNYNQTLICGEIYDIKGYSGGKIVVEGSNILIPDKFYKNNTQIRNIKKWYKQLAEQIVSNRLEQLKNATKISYKSLKICDSKAKWGSCDNFKNIKINWRVVMLPHKAIDMVLLHELVHIIEFNHSKDFYSILAKYMPDWRNQRKILKGNNFLLKLYRE